MENAVRFHADKWQHLAGDEHDDADVNRHVVAAVTVVAIIATSQHPTHLVQINHLFLKHVGRPLLNVTACDHANKAGAETKVLAWIRVVDDVIHCETKNYAGEQTFCREEYHTFIAAEATRVPYRSFWLADYTGLGRQYSFLFVICHFVFNTFL